MAKEIKKTTRISNPHDKFFKESLGRKEIARDIIKEYLPLEVRSKIDIKTLKINKDSHIDKELTDHFSDIIYSVKIKGKQSFLYLLFEHKSYAEIMTLFQLLRNMVKIWENYLKQNRNIRKLPIIVPIIFYHGKKEWKYGNKIGKLFEIESGTEKYIPDFSSELFDISHIPDEEIKGEIITQIILLTMKYIFKPELRFKLYNIFELFNNLDKKQRVTEYLEILIRYLTSAIEQKDEEVLKNALNNSIKIEGEIMPTIAEAWLQEGIAKGKAEGKEEGRGEVKEEVALKMIELKMSNSDICKITGFSIKKINELRSKY